MRRDFRISVGIEVGFSTDGFSSIFFEYDGISMNFLPRGGAMKPQDVYLLSIVLLGLSVGGAATVTAAEKPGEQRVRQTIAQSLPFIVEKGQWWIDKKKCVSCHRVSFMTWSLAAAKQKGFEVDGAKLKEWTDWSMNAQLSEHEKGGPVGSRNLEGLAQLILGATTTDSPQQAATYTQFVELIVKGQQPKGHWKPGGQLPAQKRPLAETTAVSTLWMALALAATNEKPAKPSREKALDWIKSAPEGETTEWHVVRLLIDHQQDSPGQVSKRGNVLRKQQNADGGWGWKAGDPSDALATGQVLYALRKANVPSDEEETITRAQTFLIETQQKNGSWLVPGTKRNKKGKPAETSNYWGTCWAVIGLLETLPD